MSFNKKLYLVFLSLIVFLIFAQSVFADDFLFKKDFKLGSTSNDVKELQKYLNNNGFLVSKSGPGSKGKETSFFGRATYSSLVKFQKANNIKSGFGSFNLATRSLANKKVIKIENNSKVNSSSVESLKITNDDTYKTNNDVNKYYLRGSITGLIGPVVLQNDKDEIEIKLNDSSDFIFPTVLTSGSSYNVTIKKNYPEQSCYLKNSAGVISSNVDTNVVKVACGLNLNYDPFKFIFLGGITRYVLIYTPGSNGSITGTLSQTINHGSSGSEVRAVPNSNYHFTSWSDGILTANRTDLNVESDSSLVANFSIDQYTLAYTPGSNGSITGVLSQTINHGSNGSEVIAVPNANYHFTSWSDGILTTSRTDLNITVNKSTTANFSIDQYILVYSAGSNGSITGTQTQVVDHGSNGSEVRAVPSANYHFISWSDGVLTATRTDSNIISDKSVTANFSIDQYTLTYTAGSNGSITGTLTQTINHGSNGLEVVAIPNVNYHFTSWSDGVMTASRTDLNVVSNKSVTANFSIDQYTLTYTAGSNGSITGTLVQTINHGSNGSEVVAVPDSGYYFTSWSDGVLTATRTDSNITANKSATASFAFSFVCGISTFTDDRNGEVYPTAQIGTQCWMAKNLNVGTMINNDVSQGNYSNGIQKYCQGNTFAGCSSLGGYYQWHMAVGLPQSCDDHDESSPCVISGTVQGVCPSGWHMPSDGEWTTMDTYLIANRYNYDDTTSGNKYAKSLGATSTWSDSSANGAIGNTDYSAKRNITKFNALPAGYTNSSATFLTGSRAYFWVASSFSGSFTNSWARIMYYNYEFVERAGTLNRGIGFSVRCVKN